MQVMKATSWATIVEFYACLEWDWEVRPMVRLVKALADSAYATGLYGAISLDRLLISQNPSFERQTEVLEIWFDRRSRLFWFSYQASPHEQPHWRATALPNDGFTKLEHFLRVQKWFVTYQ